MNSADLREVLAELRLTHADFARLVGVTQRAVALWMAGDRPIPGPIEGYVRLLQLLPQGLRQVEMNRLRKETDMKDGVYGIKFEGNQGSGVGVLIFDAGRVWGTDEAGVRYDGEYVFNDAGTADLMLKVTFPPNVRAVFGTSNPYEWAIDVRTSIDPKKSAGKLVVKTSVGASVPAEYFFLRGLPEAA